MEEFLPADHPFWARIAALYSTAATTSTSAPSLTTNISAIAETRAVTPVSTASGHWGSGSEPRPDASIGKILTARGAIFSIALIYF